MDKCVICGKEFLRVGVQKTCSPECSEEMTKRYMKDWHDRQYGNRIRECLVCGKKFESRYGRMLCSDECREEREKIRDQNWHKRNYEPKIKTCAICGKEFSGRGRSKTCSNECRVVYKKQQSKKEWKMYSKNKYGKIITRYLINKLRKLEDEFTYKGEKYRVIKQGNYGTLDGNILFNWIYWKSIDSNKALRMEYVSEDGDNLSCEIKEVKSIAFWEDYDNAIVLEKLNY